MLGSTNRQLFINIVRGTHDTNAVTLMSLGSIQSISLHQVVFGHKTE